MLAKNTTLPSSMRYRGITADIRFSNTVAVGLFLRRLAAAPGKLLLLLLLVLPAPGAASPSAAPSLALHVPSCTVPVPSTAAQVTTSSAAPASGTTALLLLLPYSSWPALLTSEYPARPAAVVRSATARKAPYNTVTHTPYRSSRRILYSMTNKMLPFGPRPQSRVRACQLRPASNRRQAPACNMGRRRSSIQLCLWFEHGSRASLFGSNMCKPLLQASSAC